VPLRTVLTRVIVGVVGFAVVLSLAYLMVLFIANDFNRDFLGIDRCLDRGGRWNYERRSCEGV
jgi:hypothetical protein